MITQAEVIRPYGEPLAADYPRYTAGVAMLETAERFTPVEKEPALRQLLLLIGGLRALGDGRARSAAGARRLPAALARRGRVRPRPAGVRPLRRAGRRDRRAAAPFAVAAGRAWSAPPAGRRARPRPRAPTVALMIALLRGDWDSADGASAGTG